MDNIGLRDLDLSKDEMDRFTKAFRNDEFKKLFADYCNEISDPANRKLYEKELTQLEAERYGIDVTFINPEPGYVIKTSVNGNEKVFINVSQSDKVEKPSSKRDVDSVGNRGLVWSIPHTQSPPRKDVDNKGTLCSVYDVVFHPDALHLAEKNSRFKKLLTETACDAVSKAFKVNIDLVNLKFPKLAFKGAVKPTIIRKQSTKPPTDYEPSPIDQFYPSVKTISNDLTGSKSINSPVFIPEYATPTYHITHRRNIEYHEMTHELDAKINTTIPTDLVVNVDLPLLSSTNEVTLDVTERKIYLVSEKPAKYKLQIDLPYDVSERDGNAKFDKNTRKLIVTLPVIRKKENFVIRDLCREDSGVESDHVSPKDGNSIGSNDDVSQDSSSVDVTHYKNGSTDEVFNDINSSIDTFFDSKIVYELPTFSCNTLDNNMAFTLNVKNVAPDSIVVDRQPHLVQLKFTSVGAGFFPLSYGFCVKFPETCTIADIQPDIWDNNLILQLELECCNFGSYWTGLDLENMQEHILKKDVEKPGVPKRVKQVSDIDVDVTVVTDNEIKIEIMNSASGNDDKSQNASTVDVQKKNKRKKKKQRSLSETSCDYESKSNNEEQMVNVSSTTKSIDITKAHGKVRSISESSNDDQMIPKVREFKSILKRRSSYNRSISESSVDDHVYSCSMDIGVGSIQEESGAELSESCKKTVRFDDNVRKQLFRIRSTILGQRKPKTNKRKKKKRSTQRRYSEGEASDYDENNKSGVELDKNYAKDEMKMVLEQRDSGVDLGDSGDENHKKSIQKCTNNSRNKKPIESNKGDDIGLEIEFKSGMMFDIEM